MKNGCIYEGQYSKFYWNGHGRLIYSNGSYYEGEWAHAQKSGKGKLVNKKGIKEGHWSFDQFCVGTFKVK